jgi:hypothetical protein
MDNGIRIILHLKYSEIEEVRQSEDRKTVTVILHNGNKMVFKNGQAKSIFKKLMRTKPGENLD